MQKRMMIKVLKVTGSQLAVPLGHSEFTLALTGMERIHEHSVPAHMPLATFDDASCVSSAI